MNNKNNELEIASSSDSKKLLSLEKFNRKNDSCEDLFFDKTQEWMTVLEAAAYLRKFKPNRSPSKHAVYMMVYRGVLKRRKFNGRLYFHKHELKRAIERGDSF